MTEAGHSVCAECGMGCNAGEYHPYAACLMFKQCRNSETVRANLQAVRQQGRVEGLRQAGEAYIKYLMNPEYQKSWKTFDEWCRWKAQQAQEAT